jgi:hypothetical protein
MWVLPWGDGIDRWTPCPADLIAEPNTPRSRLDLASERHIVKSATLWWLLTAPSTAHPRPHPRTSAELRPKAGGASGGATCSGCDNWPGGPLLEIVPVDQRCGHYCQAHMKMVTATAPTLRSRRVTHERRPACSEQVVLVHVSPGPRCRRCRRRMSALHATGGRGAAGAGGDGRATHIGGLVVISTTASSTARILRIPKRQVAWRRCGS